MAGAPGIVSPDSFPTRDPRDRDLNNGRTANPPRMMEVGGAFNMGIWTKEPTPHGSAQSGPSNIAPVRKPTSVKSSHKSDRGND